MRRKEGKERKELASTLPELMEKRKVHAHRIPNSCHQQLGSLERDHWGAVEMALDSLDQSRHNLEVNEANQSHSGGAEIINDPAIRLEECPLNGDKIGGHSVLLERELPQHRSSALALLVPIKKLAQCLLRKQNKVADGQESRVDNAGTQVSVTIFKEMFRFFCQKMELQVNARPSQIGDDGEKLDT